MDGRRLIDSIERLGRIGTNEKGGVDRVCLTPNFEEGARFLVSLMEEAGLHVGIDQVGNIIGTANATSRLAPVVSGSHIDTVVNGGRLDGAYGVLGAVEAIRTIKERSIEVRRPLTAVAFMNEEGVRFTAMTGSRYFSGLIDGETASALKDREGVKFEEAVKPLRAFRPLPSPPIRKACAFVELHIEQGPTLEAEKIEIGIVGAIVGIRQFDVRIQGSADHAGTTPMRMRKDSLVAASELVLMVREVADQAGAVGTVGFIENSPNAPNVVPGAVDLTVDVRHGSKKALADIESEVRRGALMISKKSGCSIRISPRLKLNPTRMDGAVKKAIGASVEDLGLSHRDIDSGAGHDTMNMANICPVGMIFVPSVGGKSHSPAERSKDGDLVNGVNVLAATLVRLAS